jgi:hypothetical protein
MRPLLGSPIRTTVRSATGGASAAGLADTAAAEAATRGARERALTAGEGRRPRRKLGCGAGDWDRGRPVNCAANIAGILGGWWAGGGSLPLFGGVRLAAVFGGARSG